MDKETKMKKLEASISNTELRFLHLSDRQYAIIHCGFSKDYPIKSWVNYETDRTMLEQYVPDDAAEYIPNPEYKDAQFDVEFFNFEAFNIGPPPSPKVKVENQPPQCELEIFKLTDLN